MDALLRYGSASGRGRREAKTIQRRQISVYPASELHPSDIAHLIRPDGEASEVRQLLFERETARWYSPSPTRPEVRPEKTKHQKKSMNKTQ